MMKSCPKSLTSILLLLFFLFPLQQGAGSDPAPEGEQAGIEQEKDGNGSSSEEAASEVEEEESSHGGMEPLLFIIIALVIGAATRHFSHKSPLPYTVTLFILGLILGAISRIYEFWGVSALSHAVGWAGNVDPHMILYVFLPTLIFEAAFAMDVHTFKKSFWSAFMMAVPGILVAVFCSGALVMLMKFAGLGFGEWGWTLALLFGAVVSATDPVAVVSLLKELGAGKKLGTLIEGESLLNDGTAIVLFMVFFAGITGEASGSSPVIEFLQVALGGVLLGIVIGSLTLSWIKRVFNDPMIEISVIVAAAYLTFYVAESFLHVSGVLGLVAFGLMMAGVGRTRISPEVEHFLFEFWELASFIANTLIFIMVGVVIAERVVFTPYDFLLLGLLYVGVFAIRGGVVTSFFPAMKRIGYGIKGSEASILWWGGLRGAISLALALVVAGEESIPQGIADRFLFLIAGIVMLTLLVNATTIKPMVKGLGLTKVSPAKALMMYNARSYLRTSAENTLERLKEDRFLSRANWTLVEDYLPEAPQEEQGQQSLDYLAETRRRILQKEKSSYWSQFKEGMLTPSAVRTLNDAINEVLDQGGNIPLSDRKDLEELWKTPKLLSKCQNYPLIGKMAERIFFDQLARSYDCARGFVVAQEDALKLIESMHRGSDDQVDPEEREQALSTVETEVNENRIHGLTFLRNLRKRYPEIYTSIATREAARSLLNYERRTVERLRNKGRLEADEVENMEQRIEERMKRLMNDPPQTQLPDNEEILRELPFLKRLDPRSFQKLADHFRSQVHSIGEELSKEGEKQESLFLIARGTVRIQMNGEDVDVVGSGQFLGEVAALTGRSSSATAVAESPVTALWLRPGDVQKAFRIAPEFKHGLWRIAAQRIGENLLRDEHPFNVMSKKHLRRWLNEGTLHFMEEGEDAGTSEQVVVLLQGSAHLKSDGKGELEAPAWFREKEASFSEDAVFLACPVAELEKEEVPE